MKRQEAMERFRSGEAAEEINRVLLRMDADLEQQKEKLAGQFAEEFLRACERIRTMQEEGTLQPVACIFIIMLRSRLQEQDAAMDIIAANREGWFDEGRKPVGSYHCGFVIPYWNELRERLESERKKYIGKTMRQDVDTILQSQAGEMLRYAARIARHGIRAIAETESFQAMQTAGNLEIMVGEYLDRAESIYGGEL